MAYYAGYNHYGIRVMYGSLGWQVKRFDSIAERDKWVKENEIENGNVVATSIRRKEAVCILGREVSANIGSRWEENENGWLENREF